MPLGWLHLSDLHQMVRTPGWLEQVRQRRVYEHLEKLHKQLGSIDVVFITGDLTMRGAPEEFEAVQRSLDALLDVLRGFGSSPCILAVPGNHDLVRPSEPSPLDLRTLRNWSHDPELRSDFWNDPANPGRRLVDRALQPFGAWWNRLLGAMPARPVRDVQTGLLAGDFTATIIKDRMHIGVVGLCSPFLQITADDYKGRLAVDPLQLNMAAGGDASDWIMKHDTALLLTHHGPNWFGAKDLARYEEAVYPPGRYTAHLVAHQHEATDSEYRDERRIIRSRLFFGKEHFEYPPTGEDRRFGYNAARLGRTKAAGQLEIETWCCTWGGRGRIHSSERGVRRTLDKFPRYAKTTTCLLERAELRDALAACYDSPEAVKELLQAAGLRVGQLNSGGAAIDVLHTGLCRASPAKLEKLVGIAAEEWPKARRVVDAWHALRDMLKPEGLRPGAVDQALLDALYEQLVALQPAMFEAVLNLLGDASDVPDARSPRAARAIAVVRQMEHDPKRVARLGLAILSVLGKRPPSQIQPGSREAGWIALGALGLVAVGTMMALFADMTKKRATQRRTPSAASLARLLVHSFDDERDFDGFALVHFPTAYRHFNSGMTREHRIAVLLKHARPEEVVDRLKRASPSKFLKFEHLLEYDAA